MGYLSQNVHFLPISLNEIYRNSKSRINTLLPLNRYVSVQHIAYYLI
jgi:hypothetical protein